jgi:hypothetical protein
VNPENLKQAWQGQMSQARLSIDTEVLVNELRHKQKHFEATILRRDVLEVGTGVVMLPVWFFMGMKLSLPWTWYLTVPAIVWVVGFLSWDRMSHKRRVPEQEESLRRCVEASLAEVEHQIWLLRNVHWWYLLPFAISIPAFFGQIAWQTRSGGWLVALFLSLLVAVTLFVLVGVYWANQKAVFAHLEPRRQELLSLRAALDDEIQAAK